MPLFNLNFPTNALFFYSMIVDISNFDIIPTDVLEKYFLNVLFKFSDSESPD